MDASNNKKRRRARRTTKATATRAVTPEKSQDAEMQIVYTPAKPFNRRWFFLRLATVAAVVLALVFGLSIFFKVQDVTVSGTEKYTEWEVFEASGVQEGDALLGLNRAGIAAKIRTALPYIGDVRVGIKLPGTVMIEVTELKVVYAIEDNTSNWWLMDATGRIVDRTDGATSKDYTRVTGVQIQDPVIGQQAKAAKPTESTEETATMPPATIPAARLLQTALQVLVAIENNGVMGRIDTVNVEDLQGLTLWYEDRFEVNLGDAEELPRKIQAMKSTAATLGEYQTGYMDVSFTIWPDQVHFKEFEKDS